MAVHHIRISREQPIASFAGSTMPRLEFRQALFRTRDAQWQHRLYRAALVVTTIAMGLDGRKLVVDHQAMRFAMLYNGSWPEPVFTSIRNWPYKPVELREGAPVTSWIVELRLRELRLSTDEWVELVFVG
ncbi:MAG: hypothetical protein IPM12_13600 [Flavobacteriales bacterium]|nr:hypothetical protein [Flavobacteriales bacterium]